MVYRLGAHIPLPGINGMALATYFEQHSGTLFGLVDLFVGGAFKRATIFALGIMPYISASIIIQLLTPILPYLQKLQKEGEEGRKKITQFTRYGTVLLASVQGLGVASFLIGLGTVAVTQGDVQVELPIVPYPNIGFRLLTILTLTAATIFIMWLGEQITEHGIGNGISLIIFIGIIARFPGGVLKSIFMVKEGVLSIFALLILGLLGTCVFV